jgi:hypothetical protein
MNNLAKIFDSDERVRILRMFLFDQESIFSVEQILAKTGVSKRLIDKEVHLLQSAGFLKRKPFGKHTKDEDGRKRRGSGWAVDRSFQFIRPLENLLIHQTLKNEPDLLKSFSKAGKLKLFVIAGLFIQEPDSRVDILVVCENLRKSALAQVVKNLEMEIGREIKYAAFELAEFMYRVSMYDKLISDVFDYPHRKILDKIGLPD